MWKYNPVSKLPTEIEYASHLNRELISIVFEL